MASLKCMEGEAMDYSMHHARDEQITEHQAHKGDRLMKNKGASEKQHEAEH